MAATVRLHRLDHSRHVTMALSTLAHQQQITAFDSSAEIGDCHVVTAMAAPDISQQALADVGRDRVPMLAFQRRVVGRLAAG